MLPHRKTPRQSIFPRRQEEVRRRKQFPRAAPGLDFAAEGWQIEAWL
jgi:hypothetical protein